MACVAMQSENRNEDQMVDEIHKYVNSESSWRIMDFDVHGRQPSIQRLAVHEQNSQMITFNENRPEEAIGNA